MWFSKLLPREGNFFVLFDQHAVHIAEGARAFLAMIQNYSDPVLREKYAGEVDVAERAADKVTADVQRLLPAGLEAETHDGSAWAGLVPFYMQVATPGGQRAPWVSNFCETNVRTYVRDRAGRSGIWFFSLDAARLGAVVTARATPSRLPYFWSSMRSGERGAEIAYLTRRRDQLR